MSDQLERRLKDALSEASPRNFTPDPANIRHEVNKRRAATARRRRVWMPLCAAAAVAALAAVIALTTTPTHNNKATPIAASPTSAQQQGHPPKTAPADSKPALPPIPPTETPLSSQCPSHLRSESETEKMPDSIRRLGDGWFGTGDLWVNAPHSATSTGVKFWSVTLDNKGIFTKDKGAPALTAQRIDSKESAESEPTAFSEATVNGEAIYFWPTTVSYLRAGTWLMTETVGTTTIQFCVSVA